MTEKEITRLGSRLHLVELVTNMSHQSAVLHTFWSAVSQRFANVARLKCYSRAALADVLTGLTKDGWALVQESRYKGDAVMYLCRGDGEVLLLNHTAADEWYEWHVATSPGGADAGGIAQEIQRRFIPPREERETAVAVHFWSNGCSGPFQREREIDAPAWAEIQENYSAAPLLEKLALLRVPGEGGQLIILTGPPGVGKTYAIRALLREWRSWCSGHYIVDPEEFFGKAAYMLTVALDAPSDGKWALMIVEDADELLTVDAKERTGQAFGRLLNLTNGLVGQGLRLLVLLTTNEAVEKLHPAVVRPGRCLAQVALGPLPQAQAREWAAAHGMDLGQILARSSWTLAELYDLLRSSDQPTEHGGSVRSAAGF